MAPVFLFSLLFACSAFAEKNRAEKTESRKIVTVGDCENDKKVYTSDWGVEFEHFVHQSGFYSPDRGYYYTQKLSYIDCDESVRTKTQNFFRFDLGITENDDHGSEVDIKLISRCEEFRQVLLNKIESNSVCD